MKKIGILTSGGDSPGMNAMIWAAVRYARSLGMEVMGIEDGYQGLLEGRVYPLEDTFIEGIADLGGTKLGTARCKAMMADEGRDAAAAAIRSFGIEGLIVGGGDGSFQGARTLTRRGIPCIGLPCTIDNDLAYTDVTIGFDTACNTAIAGVMNIRDTMTSHDRFAVVEVMGRHRGDIALMVGLAVGADEILIPEADYTQPFDFDNVVSRMTTLHAKGAKTGIIILSEGVEYDTPHRCELLAEKLEAATGMEFRATVLGHIQRGGRPTMRDRELAIRTAVRAVDLLHEGVSDRVVGMKAGEIIDCDIYEALQIPRPTHADLLKLARTLGDR